MKRLDAATSQITKREMHVSPGAHVGVPALTATLVTLALGVLVVLSQDTGTRWEGGARVVRQADMAAFRSLPVVWLVVFGVMVFVVLRFSGSIEEVIGFDIDGDGVVGKPEPVKHITAIEARFEGLRDHGVKTIIPEFELHPDVVRDLFRAALADDTGKRRGGILPASEWIGSDNPLSRDEWELFTDTLRRFDLAEWKGGHKSNGHGLTETGRAFMEQWIERN